MAKEANSVFLAIFSGGRPVFSGARPVFPDMFHGGRPVSLGRQALFFQLQFQAVPEKGVSCTESPFRTPEACFLHRMPQKMRRVPEEPFFSTECIFRTPGGPLLYRMPTTLPPQPSTTQHPQHTLPGTNSTPNTKHPIQNTPKTKEVPTECYFNRDFRKAAAAYSPTWWGSTIGASELNFSVRYGKRWILTAITAAVYYLREIS